MERREPTETKNAEGIEAKQCIDCGEPIPEKRLKAVPDAVLCVPCLEARGDTPHIKRFDEFNDQREIVEQTFFTTEPEFTRRIRLLTSVGLNSAYFSEALCDKDVADSEEEPEHLPGFHIEGNNNGYAIDTAGNRVALPRF